MNDIVYWTDTIYYDTAVDVEAAESLPSEYSLSQNYPNPFNPSTTIKYSIPKKSNVTLKVFDILGSEVATLVNKEQPKGNYEVEFDAALSATTEGRQISSGIYFYRLQVFPAESGISTANSGLYLNATRTSDYTKTKKMLLIK